MLHGLEGIRGRNGVQSTSPEVEAIFLSGPLPGRERSGLPLPHSLKSELLADRILSGGKMAHEAGNEQGLLRTILEGWPPTSLAVGAAFIHPPTSYHPAIFMNHERLSRIYSTHFLTRNPQHLQPIYPIISHFPHEYNELSPEMSGSMITSKISSTTINHHDYT